METMTKPYLWTDIPLYGKHVDLQGDPFLLTIPPADAWKDFYLMVHGSPAYHMTEQQLSGMFATFFVHMPSNQTQEPIMEYKKFWTDPLTKKYRRSPVGFIAKNQFREYKDESFNTLYFRPCLIPLTKNGEIDLLNEPDGSEFFGGYLQLTYKFKDALYDYVYGQAPDNDKNTITINQVCQELTIIDAPSPKSTIINGKAPMVWWNVCGCLVSAWNFGAVTPDDLWRLGLLPTI